MQSYTHFTLEERESLYMKLKEGKSLRAISRDIKRNVSSISRELVRNQNKDKSYHPWRATILYIIRRKACKRRYIVVKNKELTEWIINGLNQYWSPEIIAAKWKEQGKSVSHSTIYLALKKGLLSPEYSCKTHLRRHGKRKQTHKCYTIHPDHKIHDRPIAANLRERLGDWEGDTIYGSLGKGYLVTCVDRKSRYLVAGLAKEKTNEVINRTFELAYKSSKVQMPINTITLDNGSEFGGFRELEKVLKTDIYFADPHSPWQRGTNENTNGLLRFFFPKGTNFHTVTQEYLNYVITLVNNRPRKCLGWLSPIEFISKKCCT